MGPVQDLVNDKVGKESDKYLDMILAIRRSIRGSIARDHHFHFLGLRRPLSLHQARIMKAATLDGVKEKPEDPDNADATGSPALRKRRVSKETWTCSCGRKFQSYVALTIHDPGCPATDRLPLVQALSWVILFRVKAV